MESSFDSKYEKEIYLNLGNLLKKTFLGKKGDACRFCGRNGSEVAFKNNAHVLPQLLGNRFLLSYYECDDCNTLFGKYEDDLAKFLAPMRTLSGIKGKRGIPEFYDYEGKLRIKNNAKNELKINVDHLPHDDIIEGKDFETVFQANRQPFKEINVYKSIVKIGLTIIKSKDVSNFERTIAFLKENLDGQLLRKDLFKMLYSFIPGPVQMREPEITIYQRIDDNEGIPEKIMILRCANLIFYVVLPMNKNDYHLTGKVVSLPEYKHHIDQKHISTYGTPIWKSLFLSKTERLNDSMEFGLKMENIAKYKNDTT